ncbi:MAG: CDP-alcohol phosphatidyltransferase [Microbacterium sp.]
MNGAFEDRHRPRLGAWVATVVAFATLMSAPLIAGALTTGTPAALLSLPAESIAVVLILLAVPGRLRRLVASVFGVIVVVATLIAALDLGFEATIDRAFDVTEDWPAIVSAYGVISDAMGTGNAILIVALLIVLLVAAVMAVARAALHTERVTARSGRTGRVAATVVTATWILCALVGAQLWPGVPVAAADAASTLAATSAQTALNIREQEAFERALQSDRLRSTPADDRLAGLEGKDVVIAFLESYGEVAVQESSFTAGVARVLEQGGAQLARDGYSTQSAFLTSPTFGGVSWLAHATLQSGVWVDSQQKYDRLIASDRWTLTRAFEDAGWRTVAVVPSNTEPWAPGTAFYGYDATLDFRSMGYRGPAFSYARIPDQYTWKHFYDTELAGAHGPIMAEVDFVSSHTPWTPVPRLVPWSEIGDGSVFAPQPAEGLAPVDVWPDEQGVRRVYGQSVEYTLGAMFSFLHTYDQPNLVLVVLGDHQPARIVSGADAGRDVPITIISQDPAVFERIASWQWDAGVRPSPDAPIWRMDQFRDRFVDAFDR